MTELEKKCAICGALADFVVSLEATGRQKAELPFYLCREHEHFYDQLKNNTTEIGYLFPETIAKLK